MKLFKLILNLIGAFGINNSISGAELTVKQYQHLARFTRINLHNIQEHWRFHQRNPAILEYILHTTFDIPYSTLINLDLDSKSHLLEQKLELFDLKEPLRLRDWRFADFEIPAILSHDALTNIFSQPISNNLPVLELLLHELFAYSYPDLTHTQIQLKQLNWQMFQKQLQAIYQIAYPDHNPKRLTTGEEELFQAITKSPNFAQINLKEGQQQKGATCGTHSIANAWAIEQLIESNTPISAINITNQIKAIVTYCATDDLVEPETILSKATFMIPEKFEREAFLSRLNFLNYNTATGSYDVQYLVDQAILQYLPRWFMPQISLHQMAPQIKALMSLPPHIAHFICNTGYGHWFLMSVIEKTDHTYQIIYIDSATNEFSEGRKRLVIALFSNF